MSSICQVVLILSLYVVFCQALQCPTGSVFHSGFCFRPDNRSMLYKDAETECEGGGGTLAIFRSRTTQRAVFYWMKDHDLSLFGRAFWMGLKYDYLSGQHTWQFVDGTYLTPWDYQDWAEHHVTEHHNLCALITSSKWLADICDGVEHPFICQIPAQYCKLEEVIIPNGFVSECRDDGEYLFDETLEVKCLEGYTRRGPINITCQRNGTWSPIPTCEDGCLHPPTVELGSLTIDEQEWYRPGDETELICDDGYYMFINDHPKSLFSMRCAGGNKWDGYGPACLPLEAMHFSYSPHHVSTIAVMPGQGTTLQCDSTFKSYGNNTFDNSTGGVWLKDQRDISAITDTLTRFEIGMDSTLNIHNFGEDGIGLYMCLSEQNIGSVHVQAYRVVSEELDCKVNMMVTPIDVVKNEMEHALLRCFAPRTLNVWFKDGVRLHSNSRRRTLPDGSLLIEKVTYDDQGMYTCVALDKDTGCAGNASAHLSVSARSESLCGRSDDVINVKDYANNTRIQVFPWLATLWLGVEDSPFCYGALINERWVLTSTTCVYGIKKYHIPNLMVVLGAETADEGRRAIQSASNNPITFPERSSHLVEKIITHPHYVWSTTDNDIALLRLSSEVHFSPRIRPICLPPEYLFLPHPCEQVKASSGFVSGWGPIPSELRQDNPLHLWYEELVVETTTECQLSVNFRLPPALFCAKENDSLLIDDSFGQFAGDSGAPFQVWHGKRWYLFGIFTRGERATHDGLYDYFTRVDAHAKWLAGHLQQKYE